MLMPFGSIFILDFSNEDYWCFVLSVWHFLLFLWFLLQFQLFLHGSCLIFQWKLVREVNLTTFEEIMVVWAEVSLVAADIVQNGWYVENNCKGHGSRLPRFSGRNAEGLQHQQRGRCTRRAEAENPAVATAHGSCEKTCRATEDYS